MVRVGNASIDERGRALGGQAGDQTGREVKVQPWYSYPWTVVIRPKDAGVAEIIAKTMEAACKNDNIGYDQGQRTTLFDLAEKVGFDLSKVKTKCETDCSALVSVCVNAAGIKVSKHIYTGNELAVLESTRKFEILKADKYLSKVDYLRRGDILLGKGHTAVVLDSSLISSMKSPVPEGGTRKTISDVAKEVIRGKWGTGPERKKRLEAAGYDYSAVQTEVNKILKGN